MNYSVARLFQVPLLILAGVLFTANCVRADVTFLISFGPGAVSPNPDTTDTYAGYYNIMGSASSNGTSLPLLDSTGNFSSVIITTPPGNVAAGPTNPFTTWGSNGGNGYTGTALNGIIPTAAQTDVWYLGDGTSSTMTFTGLDPNMSYTFTFLASRGNGSTSTGRLGDYTFAGTNSVTLTGIDAGSSSSTGPTTFYTASNIIPVGDTITLTVAAYGTVTYGGYLNFMEITGVAIPEPSTVALAILGGLGLFVVVLRRRRQAQI